MISATEGRGKGQWRHVRSAGGVPSFVVYKCAECSHPMNLQNHQILDGGKVNPSVVCPHPVYDRSPLDGQLEDMRCPTVKCDKCSFHDYVHLIGWTVAIHAALGAKK